MPGGTLDESRRPGRRWIGMNTTGRRKVEGKAAPGCGALRVIERELAGHPVFGDTRGILGRARALVLMELEAVSRDRPLVKELRRELRKPGNRQLADAVLDDPVLIRTTFDLLHGISRTESSTLPPRRDEEVFAAMLDHLRSGTPGPPVAAGCRRHLLPGGSTPAIAIWDPDAPDSVVKTRFEFLVDKSLYSLFPGRSALLGRPEPAFVDALRQGCELLARLLPELAASVFHHVRLIGFFDDRKVHSLMNNDLPSVVFISSLPTRTPWQTAQALLHEALHQKLVDFATARSFLREGCDASTVRVFWDRKDAVHFLPRRAYAAFHVYVHLALFHARAARMEESLAGEFGAFPADGLDLLDLEKVLGRAGYFGEELAVHAGRWFAPDGGRMFAWLRQMLLRLCDADTLQAHVERLREGDRRGRRP